MLEVYFQGEIQHNYKITKIESNSMQINVYPTRAFYLRNLVIRYPAKTLPYYLSSLKFQIIVDGNALMFVLLSVEQKKIIDSVSEISE